MSLIVISSRSSSSDNRATLVGAAAAVGPTCDHKFSFCMTKRALFLAKETTACVSLFLSVASLFVEWKTGVGKSRKRKATGVFSDSHSLESTTRSFPAFVSEETRQAKEGKRGDRLLETGTL